MTRLVMAQSAAKSAIGAGGKPLLVRLRAWLGLGAKPPPVTVPRAARIRAEAAQEPASAPLSRMTVAQWLWGDGFVMPGDADFVLDLVKPFGLSPAMSMLDLSAGLGGPARVIAQAYGTYVTGLERSPERAKHGMEVSTTANLAKRAAIAHYDPESVELRANSFDCILGRGATYNVVEKERLLRVLYGGLKQRGQLVLNEFTVDPAAGKRPELASWAAKESFPPQLWTIAQYTDCLTSLGFDVRVIEDVTALYRNMIVAGWARLLKEVDLRAMSRKHRVTVVDEAELWMYRIGALESGALRVFKVYALVNKPAK
jgi:cyclopropane fatty-acyl-phospholipid synthase-like methyltransferase